MPYLHTLTKHHRPKKRIGRGGKRGTYSGRGQKGQRARAGRKIRPALRDVIKKLPKKRGHRMRFPRRKAFQVSIGFLNETFDDGTVITPALLRKSGIKTHHSADIKILAHGALTKRFTIKGMTASRASRERIAERGGSVL